MNKKSKSKQSFNVDVIKTPKGQVPTIESFHKVIDGLFGEILDTRKDVAKLIPNLEKELSGLREIIAQQMVLFEVINNSMDDLQKEITKQGKKINKIQKATAELGKDGLAEAELTDDSKKAIAQVIQTELKNNTKPISDALSAMQKELEKSSSNSYKKMDKELSNIKDQIDDLSSKSELQMLEILESVNPSPSRKSKSSSNKKKLSS